MHVGLGMKPFSQQKDELILEAGCLMWRIKFVISTKFWLTVLDELHTSHAGISKGNHSPGSMCGGHLFIRI